MMKDDWTVKMLPRRNEDEEDRYYIKVKVRINHSHMAENPKGSNVKILK